MPEAPLRVLLVDDQPAIVKALEILLDLEGIEHVAATTPDEARAIAGRETLGAVVQDMNFARNETSGDAGIALFHQLQELQPGLPVLLMTAWASLETAVDLVRGGAFDYIEKPWDDEKLVATVRRLLKIRSLELENARLREELQVSRSELAAKYDLRGLVYASQSMHEVVTLALHVARSNAPVMITGPNGCGKERIAEVLQANSKRSGHPFVRVNVGAIPDELMESELFGAEAGAYTGLSKRRIGHFETAHRGTLFLDEIDALSLSSQVKLLRVVQSGEFQRLGSSATHTVDTRIVAASNADLGTAVAEGRFREDLFFRLAVVELDIEPLAARTADILPLALHFLEKYAGEEGLSEVELSAEARAELLRHEWSGNVRELENRIRRATLVGSTVLQPHDLGLGAPVNVSSETAPNTAPPTAEDEAERQQLLDAITRAGGIVAHAADALQLSRQALYRKMARLGIEVERRPKA